MKNQGKVPTLNRMMSLRRPLIALACAAMLAWGFLPVAHAQTTPTADETSRYSTGEDSPLGLPSGLINLRQKQNVGTLDRSDEFAGSMKTTVDGNENLQGCGGVTQSDYTSAIFNMPEVFNKFKKDVNTDLAKQILTYNYSLPQTAALFDTLNTYGNARFQQFQKACNLDSLKQDAKNQFVRSCMSDTLIKARKDIIDKANKSTSGSSGAGASGVKKDKFTDDEVEAQAYAQAWEICNNQYVSDTTLVQLHKDVNKAFAESMRASEDVNAAIRPLLCDYNNTDQPCWPNLFLPQVRICNGDEFTDGCDDKKAGTAKGYGVKDPPITVVMYTDFMRFALEDFKKKVIEDFYQKVNNVDVPTQEKAATAASYKLMMGMETYSLAGYANVAGLQQYMNCRSDDITSLLKTYGGEMSITPATYEVNDYRTISDKMDFPKTADKDKDAFPHLVHTVLGCTVNQVIPILDPKITFYLNNKCQKNDLGDDRAAFYAIASYDVTVNAARDTYRYLEVRLKQVYGRLLNEGGAGVSGTLPAAAGSTDTKALDSPELRRRLASAVKEIMLPAVESQIERLNELNATRGQFAQRVQKIYKDRQGCVSGEVGAGAGN